MVEHGPVARGPEGIHVVVHGTDENHAAVTTAGEEKTAPPVGALQMGVKSAALPALIGEPPTAAPW